MYTFNKERKKERKTNKRLDMMYTFNKERKKERQINDQA